MLAHISLAKATHSAMPGNVIPSYIFSLGSLISPMEGAMNFSRGLAIFAISSMAGSPTGHPKSS